MITGFCGTERHDEALAALLDANRKLPDDPLRLAEVAYCRALAGENDRARELLEQVEALSSSMYVSPVARAMVHVGLGEHDLALNALEQGIRERDFRVIYLGIDSTWDPLRENRRFIELLERVGLPQAQQNEAASEDWGSLAVADEGGRAQTPVARGVNQVWRARSTNRPSPVKMARTRSGPPT